MLQQIFNVIFPILTIVLMGYFYGRRHAPDVPAGGSGGRSQSRRR